MELLLTKLLFYSRRISNFKHTNEIKILENSQSSLNKCCDSKAYGIQIVGMSATLPNLKTLGQWLNAEVYITNFRPVPLTEFILSCDLRSKTNQFYKIVKSASKYDSSTQQLLSECLELADNLPLDPQLTSDPELNMIDEDGVFALCFDTLLNGHGVLVFCPTKQWCEQLADTMARQIFILTQSYFSALHQNDHNPSDANIGNLIYKNSDDHSVQSNIGTRLALQLDRVGLATCVEQLKRCPAGLDTILARCLGYGVAFHHAGLTVEEREIIEFGFRKGLIRILIATSTLSSGVNLPARRVIIRTPLFHGKVLDFLTYKQMSGRAGRQGVDTSGQSILLCKSKDLGRVRQLIMNGMPPVNSCLMGDGETLADALLYLSSTLLATTVTWEKLNEFNNSQSTSTKKNRRRSLRLSQPKTYSENEINVDDNENNNNNRFTVQMKRLLFTCIKDLQKHEFIYIDQSTCPNLSKNVINTSFTDSQSLELSLNGARLQPTALGRAVLSSSLGPVHGLIVYEELDRARRSIALDTELHLVYLLTPVYLDVGADLDWLCYLEQYQSLSSSERRVADLIGIEERFITRCAAGAPSSAASCHGNTNMVNRRLNLHRRFYTALVLYRLVNEDGLQIVAKKFGVNRGLLQSLQQQAATYAGMVTIFCNRLGWNHMERVIANFQSRLCYGVSDELVDLIRLLPLVNAERARALYAGGYSSVSSLASARPQEISRIIQRAIPFERKNNHEVCVVKPSGGCTILLDDGRVINEHEAGFLIVQQAKLLLEIDLTSVYGKDLIIIPKNHESENSMKPVKSIIENVSDCNNINKNDIVDSKNNQLMTPNLSYNSLHDLNLTRGCKYFMDKNKNHEHLNVKVEEVEVKRLKLSLDNDTTVQTSSMSAARTSSLINSDDHKNPNVDHEFCSVNKENYSSDNNKTDYENSISITSNLHIPVSKFDSSVNHHGKTVIDFENFTQSSQPFILTSQLAAIIDDDQVVLTNKLTSPSDTSISRFNVKSNLLHSPISCEPSSIPFSTTTTPSSLSVSNKTCEFNDTLTYSMFESSFTVSNNTSITTNNDNIIGPICDIITTETLKEQYDDSQILNNLMMINCDTDIGKKQELSISHQQSHSNLSKAPINPNESFLNMERKSIGDLFSASFTHDSPTNEVQLIQESSDYQHMYSIKTAECKTGAIEVPSGSKHDNERKQIKSRLTKSQRNEHEQWWAMKEKETEKAVVLDTNPPSADDNLIADSLENGVDDDNDKDNIFSVINVTQNYTLWKTFLTELNDHIEGLKSSNQSQLNYIAIQPGWLLNTNSDSNNDNDFRSSSESLCWKSGPAGQPTVGGGKNICTNYDLCLSGLAISSVHLMKNAVFWIHFLTESG
ncbi:unnamed protein product [Schistosoma margrebowiei]|uniref:Helicase C-terminal domain-containing protein n=1 Tax=Schistosoma margrebowiei TaxID=48269 RepID=A0A3P7YET7_9TREM|nr:unnamed protein product [Schistosoma margrebowiei]